MYSIPIDIASPRRHTDTDRQTDRQTETHRHTDTQTHRQAHMYSIPIDIALLLQALACELK
jgi:hypothetical protein